MLVTDTDKRTDEQMDSIDALSHYRCHARRLKNQKKIWQKTFFNTADRIITPCNVTAGSGMTHHEIRPNVRHIGILHLVLILTISPAVDMSFCTSLRNQTTLSRKKLCHVDF